MRNVECMGNIYGDAGVPWQVCNWSWSHACVGYALDRGSYCGFVSDVRRIRSEARPSVRVWHKRASNVHWSVFLGAGLAQACVGYAPGRAARCGFGTNVRRMCIEACPRCLFDVSVRHMCIGACVRCLFGAYSRRIRTEAGNRLSACRHRFNRRGSQRAHLSRRPRNWPPRPITRLSRQSPLTETLLSITSDRGGHVHKETVSRNTIWT